MQLTSIENNDISHRVQLIHDNVLPFSVSDQSLNGTQLEHLMSVSTSACK